MTVCEVRFFRFAAHVSVVALGWLGSAAGQSGKTALGSLGRE